MSAITTYHRDLFVVAQSKLDAMTESDLTELVKETNGKSVQAAKQTLLHVAQTGLVLIVLKEKKGHGRFMKEVERLTGIHHRTANNYMAIARQYRNVSKMKNVSDALRYLREVSTRAQRLDEGSSLAPSKPDLPLGATYQEAEIVESPSPVTIEAEIVESSISDAQDDEMEVMVVDGTKVDEVIEKENPWDTSRQAIAELAKLDDKISSPLGDVLAYIEKRWKLTFNLKTRK